MNNILYNVYKMIEKKRNYSKYEEVIIKTILANQIFEKSFFDDEDTTNWREEVDKIYNSEDFNGDYVLAEFIINGSFDNNKEYKTTNFLPTNLMENMDINMDKKFASKNDLNLENNLEEIQNKEVFQEDFIEEI